MGTGKPVPIPHVSRGPRQSSLGRSTRILPAAISWRAIVTGFVESTSTRGRDPSLIWWARFVAAITSAYLLGTLSRRTSRGGSITPDHLPSGNFFDLRVPPSQDFGEVSEAIEKGEEFLPFLSVNSRQRPTLPRRLQRSTIGPGGLNFRVRNGTGCFPSGMATGRRNSDGLRLEARHSAFDLQPSTRNLLTTATQGPLRSWQLLRQVLKPSAD
jgi:hypothetical protein